MTLSSPYLIYIIGAYGLTFLGLGFFLIKTGVQWKSSLRGLKNVPREA